MNKRGWLVNDCLTCISGTKTLWNDILEWIPGLEDKTRGYTDYSILANIIEQEAKTNPPDYIIRNGSYFRPLNIPCKTISLIQDIGAPYQIEVGNSSDMVIYNSNYTYQQYKDKITKPYTIIPIGTDSKVFNVIEDPNPDILPESILYVGSSLNHPKGFNHILDLIHNTNYNFTLIMKDDYKIEHPRVRCFNKLPQDKVAEIMNCCSLLVCTSVVETQHLSSIEMLFCNRPIITTNIGIYYKDLTIFDSTKDFGIVGRTESFQDYIRAIKNGKVSYNKCREWAFENKLDKESCKQEWIKLIESI